VISQSVSDKQREILNTALKLFVENGFHATPTSMIAKQAGVANGTLFHYYPTKDELIVALYTEIKTDLAMCVLSGAVEGESLKDTWKRHFSTAIEWGIEHPIEFKFTLQFANSPYMSMVPDELKKQSQLTLDFIKEAIKTKVIKLNEPELLNTMLMSHLYGVNQYIAEAKLSYPERKKIINKAFDMLWDMMTA
jgi:AcrR family transcriptional regulator